AQTAWKITATVPFDFNVGSKTLPAGEYSVVTPKQHFMQLLNARGVPVAYAFTGAIESGEAAEKTLLQFHRIDGQYFLNQVWVEGEQRGEQLYISTPRTVAAKNVHSTAAGNTDQGNLR